MCINPCHYFALRQGNALQGSFLMPCPIFVPCVTICNGVSTPVTETSHCVFGSVTFCNGALISSLSSRIWRFHPTFLPGIAEDDLSHHCPIFVPYVPHKKSRATAFGAPQELSGSGLLICPFPVLYYSLATNVRSVVVHLPRR